MANKKARNTPVRLTSSQLGQFLRRYDFILQAAALVIALFAVFLLIRLLPTEYLFDWLERHMERLGRWAPVAFVLLFIGLTVVFLPGWPLNVVAGVLFGPLPGGAIASIASTAAAAVSFLIGRYVAHDWVKRNVRRFPRIYAVYRQLRRAGGWKVVAAVRLSHSLPFGVQNLLLGASPARFVPYLLTTWLITLPGIFFIAYLGHLAGRVGAADELPSQGFLPWLVRGVGVVVAAAAIAYLGRFALKAIEKSGSIDRAETPLADSSNTAWPWGTVTALVAALVLLSVSVWLQVHRMLSN